MTRHLFSLDSFESPDDPLPRGDYSLERWTIVNILEYSFNCGTGKLDFVVVKDATQP